MKLRNIEQSRIAMSRLGQKDLPVKLAHKVSLANKELEIWYNIIVDKYKVDDKIPEDKLDEANKDYEKLLEEDIDDLSTASSISISDFPDNFSIDPQTLSGLNWLITE